MKRFLRWFALPLLALSLSQSSALAADVPDAKAQAKADYPLTTCVVSDEPLNHEGKSVEYVHKQAGKPDRLVIFCCEDCVKDFEKEPAKYLAKLDAAAAAKPKGGEKKS